MIDNILLNIVAGLIILVLDILFTYLIINRVISGRDKKRWEPFRQFLFNILIAAVPKSERAMLALTQDLNLKTDNLQLGAPMPKDITDDYLSSVQYWHNNLKEIRNEVFNAIQTASPSISTEISKKFTFIFRALEKNVKLTQEMGQKFYQDEFLLKRSNVITVDIKKELSLSIAEYMMKVNFGIKAYEETILHIIRSDGFIIDEDGEVFNKEELELREEMKRKFDAYRKNMQ